MVFGDDAKIKLCAFHSKDHRNIKAKKLNSKSNDKCVTGCYCAQLLLNTRPSSVIGTYFLQPMMAGIPWQTAYHGGVCDMGSFSIHSPTPTHHKWSRLKWFLQLDTLRLCQMRGHTVSVRCVSSSHTRCFTASHGDQSLLNWGYTWRKGAFVCWLRMFF